MSAITYRDAAPADASLLANLFERSFTDTFGHLYKAEDLSAFLNQLDEQGWAEELGDPRLAIRIAEADGAAVAFAKVGTLSLPVTPDRPAIELRQLYVLKPWQGAGIAHELMRWALDFAKARLAKEMYLTVYVDNHRARRFYERYGFTFVAPYAFMVGNQADEDHIMRLDLEAQ
jgi:ribosomal protein S18 acetylase RimI-like enzyme